jgi:putative flippase GtrA
LRKLHPERLEQSLAMAGQLRKDSYLNPVGWRRLPAILQYLLVGVCNFLFGYGCYAGFVAVYKQFLPPQDLYLAVDLASATATPIGVTASFLTYKFFVFRTRGNYLREWLKCMLVYGAASLPGLFILPVVTKLLLMFQSLREVAPYLAGAIVMGGTTIFTYLAHKNFSFSTQKLNS